MPGTMPFDGATHVDGWLSEFTFTYEGSLPAAFPQLARGIDVHGVRAEALDAWVSRVQAPAVVTWRFQAGQDPPDGIEVVGVDFGLAAADAHQHVGPYLDGPMARFAFSREGQPRVLDWSVDLDGERAWIAFSEPVVVASISGRTQALDQGRTVALEPAFDVETPESDWLVPVSPTERIQRDASLRVAQVSTVLGPLIEPVRDPLLARLNVSVDTFVARYRGEPHCWPGAHDVSEGP